MTIPANIGELPNLTSLKLDHNSLSGTLPASFQDLQKLVLLQLQSNRLIGTIVNVTVHGKENNSSFISDCGVPSKFLEPVFCEACTMCCNTNEECHVRDLPVFQRYEWAWGYFFILLLGWLLLFGASSVLRRAEDVTEIEEVIRRTGTKSVYVIILGTNRIGWALAAAIVIVQHLLLFILLKASKLDFTDSSAWVYNWTCPVDVKKCDIDSTIGLVSWVLFYVTMLTRLLPDILSACRLAYLVPRVQTKKKNAFVSSLVLYSVSSLSVVVTIFFNYATARTDADLLLNAIAIYCVNELDEAFFKLLNQSNPEFVDRIKDTMNGQERNDQEAPSEDGAANVTITDQLTVTQEAPSEDGSGNVTEDSDLVDDADTEQHLTEPANEFTENYEEARIRAERALRMAEEMFPSGSNDETPQDRNPDHIHLEMYKLELRQMFKVQLDSAVQEMKNEMTLRNRHGNEAQTTTGDIEEGNVKKDV